MSIQSCFCAGLVDGWCQLRFKAKEGRAHALGSQDLSALVGDGCLSASCRGFCYFNSVAVAARLLQQRLSVSRILIVDWVSGAASQAGVSAPASVSLAVVMQAAGFSSVDSWP